MFCLSPEDRHFSFLTKGGGKNILCIRDGDDDVDGGWGEDVSEASKLSAGTRIF